uniref:Putative ovule protein n=1 Tax=Solanum chacoense TaxID=4108 RepID=A0A0V0ILC4_SOLCH
MISLCCIVTDSSRILNFDKYRGLFFNSAFLKMPQPGIHKHTALLCCRQISTSLSLMIFCRTYDWTSVIPVRAGSKFTGRTCS